MDRAGIEALHAVADPTRLRVLAALLSRREGDPPTTAESVAEATGLAPRRVERALRQLAEAGLTGPGPDDVDLAVLADAVDAAVRERPLERALRPGSPVRGLVRRGVLLRIPTKLTVQRELAEVLAGALPPFSEVSEEDLNAILADMHSDVAVLRRLLVDWGWLSRDPSTQTYWPTAQAGEGREDQPRAASDDDTGEPGAPASRPRQGPSDGEVRG